MGQHTWFYKDKAFNESIEELSDILSDKYPENHSVFDLIDKIDDFNEAEYHNLFRTSKRNEDGSHLDMVINSREECFEWINNPDNMVWYCSDEDLCRVQLNEFWDKYPNGYITL